MGTVDEPPQRRGAWIIVVAVGALAFASAYLASPFVALLGLYSAVQHADASRLEELIDFPSVRAHLKAQIDVAFVRSPTADTASIELARLIDGGIDRYMAPEALATLLVRSRHAPQRRDHQADEPQGDGVAVAPRVRYQGVERFEASIVSNEDPSQAFTLQLARRGLFRWRLVSVVLPPDALRAMRRESIGSERAATAARNVLQLAPP